MTNALLLGIRSNLPQSLVDEFNATGTSHILAISGLHVAVVLGILLAFSQFMLGRWWQLYFLVPFIGVWFYAFMSGTSPSVTRAAIMTSVYLLARLLGRQGSGIHALGLAAAVMVGLNPNVLWDVSLQLSFAAVTGIALLSQPVKAWLSRLVRRSDEDGRLVSLLLDAAAVTLAATAATYPLIAFYFHRASTIGALATLLVLPVLTPLLVFGIGTALVGLISAALALPFGWFTWAFAAYLTGAVRLLSLIPGSSVEIGTLSPYMVWGYYFVLFAVVVFFRYGDRFVAVRQTSEDVKERLREKGAPWAIVMIVMAVAALIWVAALSVPDGNLHVAFLDLAEGDSIFITTPAGQQVLIDGGPDPLGAVR